MNEIEITAEDIKRTKAEPSCGVCEFFRPSNSALGECVRFPPAPAYPGGPRRPLVHPSDICGEFHRKGSGQFLRGGGK